MTILAVAAISLFTLNSEKSNVDNQTFNIWKLKFNKKYDAKEEAYRLSIWLENFAYVEAHNARY